MQHLLHATQFIKDSVEHATCCMKWETFSKTAGKLFAIILLILEEKN